MSDNPYFRRSPDSAAASVAERYQSQSGPDTELLSPATQIVGDKDVYLGNATHDIGRRVSEEQLELFVVCHPAEAMLQQFAQHAPDFIAIHDVGTTTSARLIAAVATAAQRKLQKLVIRRQGYGVALATLQFVELPLQPGRNLRVYTTQIDADTQTRHQLAQVLLAHSRLGVLMVGDLPQHALASTLQPIRDAIAAGPWPNRQLLLVPLASAAAMPAQSAALAGNSAVMVSTTPQVARPSDAWSYISGAWNRLKSAGAGTDTAAPKPAAPRPPPPAPPPPLAPPMFVMSRPLELNPMPGGTSHLPAQRSASEAARWADYVQRCSSIGGVSQACVFDIDHQRSLAHSGTQRAADRLAAKGSMLHALMVDTANVLGLEAAQPDAVITLAKQMLLIRPMPGQPKIALHLVLERSQADLPQLRAHLHQIDQTLLGATA